MFPAYRGRAPYAPVLERVLSQCAHLDVAMTRPEGGCRCDNSRVSNTRRWALLALALVITPACSTTVEPRAVPAPTTPDSNTPFELAGTVSLFSDVVEETTPGDCAGIHLFGDFKQGASVQVTQGTGEQIGFDRLSAGSWTSNERCDFPFSVEVEGGHEFYNLNLPGGYTVTLSPEKARAGNVEVNIG